MIRARCLASGANVAEELTVQLKNSEPRNTKNDAEPAASRSASELDDEEDREELRQRYYGLLQELRVLLPGVQVLAAFLLTAPLASRFTELDDTSRFLYGVSLVTALISVVCFVAPTAFHRVGPRTSRSRRLSWAIQMTRAGTVFMAIALECALYVIFRLIFSDAAALVAVISLGLLMIVVWVVLPTFGLRRSGASVGSPRR
jgi:cation transport ATPase